MWVQVEGQVMQNTHQEENLSSKVLAPPSKTTPFLSSSKCGEDPTKQQVQEEDKI